MSLPTDANTSSAAALPQIDASHGMTVTLLHGMTVTLLDQNVCDNGNVNVPIEVLGTIE